MKVIGFCAYGRHVRYVNVTASALVIAQVTKSTVVGICDSCKAEKEKRP